MKLESTTGTTRRMRAPLALMALMSCVVQALAQDAPAPRIGDPEYGKSDRSVRAADSPLRWIKLHAEGGRTPAPAPARERDKDAAPAPAPAAKARPVPAKPVAAKPAAAPAPAPATAAVAGPPAPSAAASAATEPPQAAVADEVPDLEFVERAEPAWDAPTMTKLRVGRVEVRFDVAVDGHTSSPRIVSSTNKLLDKVALDTIRKWRFEPISKPRSATVEFGFDLDAARAEPAPAAAPAPGVELVAIEQPEPEWGDALMQKLRKAQAQVRISIGTDGKLARYEVLGVSHPQLTDPINAALKKWRFQPIDRPLTATVEFGFDVDRAAR